MHVAPAPKGISIPKHDTRDIPYQVDIISILHVYVTLPSFSLFLFACKSLDIDLYLFLLSNVGYKK